MNTQNTKNQLFTITNLRNYAQKNGLAITVTYPLAFSTLPAKYEKSIHRYASYESLSHVEIVIQDQKNAHIYWTLESGWMRDDAVLISEDEIVVDRVIERYNAGNGYRVTAFKTRSDYKTLLAKEINKMVNGEVKFKTGSIQEVEIMVYGIKNLETGKLTESQKITLSGVAFRALGNQMIAINELGRWGDQVTIFERSDYGNYFMRTHYGGKTGSRLYDKAEQMINVSPEMEAIPVNDLAEKAYRETKGLPAKETELLVEQ
jgi:hypothetical protein